MCNTARTKQKEEKKFTEEKSWLRFSWKWSGKNAIEWDRWVVNALRILYCNLSHIKPVTMSQPKPCSHHHVRRMRLCEHWKYNEFDLNSVLSSFDYIFFSDCCESVSFVRNVFDHAVDPFSSFLLLCFLHSSLWSCMSSLKAPRSSRSKQTAYIRKSFMNRQLVVYWLSISEHTIQSISARPKWRSFLLQWRALILSHNFNGFVSQYNFFSSSFFK